MCGSQCDACPRRKAHKISFRNHKVSSSTSLLTSQHRDIKRTMMNSIPKNTLTRCKTQIRCMSSSASLTRTVSCTESTNFLTLNARSNQVDNTKASLAELPRFYDQSMLNFSPAAENLQLRGEFQEETIDIEDVIQAMNRNARKPKKANKGSRPCSRAGRRRKKEKIGKRSR